MTTAKTFEKRTAEKLTVRLLADGKVGIFLVCASVAAWQKYHRFIFYCVSLYYLMISRFSWPSDNDKIKNFILLTSSLSKTSLAGFANGQLECWILEMQWISRTEIFYWPIIAFLMKRTNLTQKTPNELICLSHMSVSFENSGTSAILLC